MRPSAGQFNKRGTIQRKSITRGPSGQQIESWSDVAAVWLSVLNQSGREVTTAREVLPELTHSVMIRYRKGINSGMRLVMDSRIFDILAVRNRMEQNEVLLLDCKEGRI
jgi:SPP1 family predicted phage head-tail adaptor